MIADVDIERVMRKIGCIREQVNAVEDLVKTSERQMLLNDPLLSI